MRVLLLSAYDAQSHAQWRRALQAMLPHWQWTEVCLPARYFAWRVRGNSLSLAFGEHADTLREPYDLVVATSMTDLSALRGFVPELARIPTAVYFHENQFAYPTSSHTHNSVEPQVLNLYTALAADYVLFNSHFNRRSFLQGVSALLKKLPDLVPKGLPERLEKTSEVLPVPLPDLTDASASDACWSEQEDPLRIVWAARWEFDKDPELLNAILMELDKRNIDFRLALLGQRFRHTPRVFDDIIQRFSERIDQQGFVESRAAYLSWLASADYILSTAQHEFQGLAVLEAVALGCCPLLPQRQVYPEYFTHEHLYNTTGDVAQQAESAVDKLVALQAMATKPEISVASFASQHLCLAYESVLTRVANR